MTTLRIEHKTSFTYENEVVSSYNEARLTPAWLPRQRVLESRIEVSPVTWRQTYRDYWETDVTVFEVLQPHQALSVLGSSLVEVGSLPSREERATWDAITGPRFQDLLCEYLVNTPTTEPTEQLLAFATEAAHTGSPDETARAICDYLYDEVKYVSGVTSVHTPAAHAW